MNPIFILILLILCIIVFFLTFRLLRSLIKAGISVFLLLFFVLVLFTAIAVYDLNNLRVSLQDNVNFVVLEEGEIYSEIGLTSAGDDTFEIGEGLNETEVDSMLNLLIELDYLVADQSVKVLDFGIELEETHLRDIYEANNIGDIHLILEDAGNLNVTRSSQILNSLITEFLSEEDFKKAITINLLSQRFRSDYTSLINDIRDQKIGTDPEFISMRIIRNMPNFLANRLIGSE